MMQNKKIAVTGGIGSGKSYVCALLREMGYPVFSCDEINRRLWRDQSYRAELAARFPDCVQGGEIGRELLAKKVFSDRTALEKLNAFSHPRIMRALIAEMNRADGVSFAEVPLLFEGGYEPLFDGVIAVRRPAEARIWAVMERDGLSRAQVQARMRKQFPPERLEEKSCLILENEGNVSARLAEILQKFGVK